MKVPIDSANTRRKGMSTFEKSARSFKGTQVLNVGLASDIKIKLKTTSSMGAMRNSIVRIYGEMRYFCMMVNSKQLAFTAY